MAKTWQDDEAKATHRLKPPAQKKEGGPRKEAATQRSHSSAKSLASLTKKFKDFWWATIALDREELQEFVQRELGSSIEDVEYRIAAAVVATGRLGKAGKGRR